MTKPTVLVLMGGYWPAHDATGPNQSLEAQCRALADRVEFRIIARDRPFGASAALAPTDCWIDRGFARVHYCRATGRQIAGLSRLLRETPYDLIAANGFHDREFTIPTLVLRKLGAIPRRPMIVSTRGELAAGALGIKAFRKSVYRAFARVTGLLDDVWLHATGREEAEDIERYYQGSRKILIAPNIKMLPARPKRSPRQPRQSVRLAFVGRIARVKNLTFAIEVLRRVSVEVTFDIYGPFAESSYVAELKAAAATLPDRIRVQFHGPIPHGDVAAVLADADLFFLPTLGENFGHAIFEALSCGVPALISDRTPWRELERDQGGWSLPLDDPDAFVAAVEGYVGMSEGQRQALSDGARALAERYVLESRAVEANRQMFETALGTALRSVPEPVLSDHAEAWR